jgi:F-type H+-transporting ATPase subunit a
MEKELPNIVSLLAQSMACPWLLEWENLIFSLLVAAGILSLGLLCVRGKQKFSRLYSAAEGLVSGVDQFICGILGSRGRAYTPFIGTLFIYILAMNLIGLAPFFKSPTSSWSTTLGLALCVFFYVQYTAFKELGFLGYLDHVLGKPRGILAFSVFIPATLFMLHIASELIRPISLSLRLRSNIWGDDMLLAVLSGFGPGAVPLVLFSMLIIIISAVVQALVFSLLTTIYFALILTGEDSTGSH